MFFSGISGAGIGGRTSIGGNADRTQVLGRRYQPFSNPFFDHASTYTPPSIKALFGFCRFYFLTHGIINAVVTKAAEYPITDLIIQHKDKGVRSRWEELFLGVLNYRVHQYEINLDYYVYGNAFVSVSFPFRKKLKCGNCRAEHDALNTRPSWRYINHRFWFQCPSCGQTDFASSRDEYYPKYSEIGLIRWNPEYVHIFYNEATGRMDYGLDISPDFRSQIMMGRKDLVATTPEIFLEAVKTRRQLVFDRSEVFHLRRPGLSTMSRGWGIPLLLPVLKDAFYIQVMKKAQEAVLLTHLVPQIFLFPQPATAGADPFCVSPDTLVETIDGLKPAAEVRDGDWLRSHVGVWRRVEASVRRQVPKDEKIYRFKVSTLPAFPFTVSEDHPILAAKNPQKRGGRRFDTTAIPDAEFIEAQKLEVGDFCAYPIKRTVRSDLTVDVAAVCGDEFAATDDWVYARLDQESAEIYEYFEREGVPAFRSGPQAERQAFLDSKGWNVDRYKSIVAMQKSSPTRHPRYIKIDSNWATIIGYYVAEGSTSQYRTTFSFNEHEHEYIAELQQALRSCGYKSAVDHRPEQGVRNVRVDDVVLASFLRNLCGQYSNQKHLPAVISEADDTICWQALRCVFNGDGSYITTGTIRTTLKTVSLNLAAEVRRLLLSFGFIGGISRCEPREDEIAKQPYYQVYYNGRVGVDLAKKLGWSPGSYDTRASEKNAFIRGDYLYMRIKSIDEVDEPEVIGFQMSGERTFCVAGVATHNTTVDLANWREHIRRELARQRQDPSYYGILPFPLGHQVIGENGRNLLLMPEIRQMSEMLVASLGFPVDLVFGHSTYAGTSVSMRMLENFFLSNVLAHKRLLEWVMKRLGAYMNWPLPEGRFKPFRMADDLQRQAMMMSLNQAGKISDATLLSYTDLKVEDEAELMASEAKIKAEALRQKTLVETEAQGEAQLVMAKYQARAQAAMQAAQARELAPKRTPFDAIQGNSAAQASEGYSMDAVAAALANKIKTMPPEQQRVYLQQLQSKAPEALELLRNQGVELEEGVEMPQLDPGQPQPAAMPAPPVDMRPMPEQLPPRRPGAV